MNTRMNTATAEGVVLLAVASIGCSRYSHRRVVLMLAIATMACAPRPPITETQTSGPLVTGRLVELPPVLANVGGEYALSGKSIIDHCGGTVEFVAKQLILDPGHGIFRVDIANRDYRLRMVGNELVAHGAFNPLVGCGVHEFVETWRLHPLDGDDDILVGQLITYHRGVADRDCLRACKLVTSIHARRSRIAQPVDAVTD